MALTDSAIRALKPRDAVYKMADEKGLCLMVTPAGARSPTRTSFAMPITAAPIGGERVDMARWWAEYLDVLRIGADVLPVRAVS
jgi:hypothetical protein